MIQVSNLSKRYGNFLAVDKISFNLKKGEILGFLGPNGAGKTTVMRIITGFLSATGGEVKVAGYDVFTHPLEVKRQIHKLSKGYRQRVGLAQALIHNPPILVLDEPSAGLDPHQIIEVRRMIRQLAGAHSVLLSTHILPEASITCDRVLIINRGKILAEDSTERLTGKIKDSERLRLACRGAPKDLPKTLAGLPGIIKVDSQPADSGTGHGVLLLDVEYKLRDDSRGRLARAVVEAGAELLELRAQTMTLEEIFIKITSRDR